MSTGRWLRQVAAGLLFCICWLTPAVAEPLQVTIVQSERGGAYDELTDALRTALSGKQISLNIVEAGQPVSARSSDLFVAIGMKAASQLAASDASAILNVLIPRSGYRKLLTERTARAHNLQFSAIYIDQPAERQLALLALAFPDRHRVGLLSEDAADEETEQLRRRSPEFGLKLYERKIVEGEPLFEGLQDVLQHSDILLALPAPAIYNSNTLRNILLSTYRSGIPLAGFSAAYVRAGAVIATYTSPAQFAEQASTAILKFADTGTLPPAQYPRLFEITINERVAQSMGLHLPSPDELLKKIESSRRRAP